MDDGSVELSSITNNNAIDVYSHMHSYTNTTTTPTHVHYIGVINT